MPRFKFHAFSINLGNVENTFQPMLVPSEVSPKADLDIYRKSLTRANDKLS